MTPPPKIFGLSPERAVAAIVPPVLLLIWFETVLALFVGPVLWLLLLNPDGGFGRAVDRLWAKIGLYGGNRK